MCILVFVDQVVIPSYASWFEPDRVHDIEQRALPDLTSSPAASSHYISLRNRMISLYRDIAGRPLEAIDCLRHLAADAATVVRVHAFLDFWGIINTDAQGRVRFQKTLMMLSEPPPPRAADGAAGSKGKEKEEVRGYAKCAVTGAPLQRVCFACKTDSTFMISPIAYNQVPSPVRNICRAGRSRKIFFLCPPVSVLCSLH